MTTGATRTPQRRLGSSPAATVSTTPIHNVATFVPDDGSDDAHDADAPEKKDDRQEGSIGPAAGLRNSKEDPERHASRCRDVKGA